MKAEASDPDPSPFQRFERLAKRLLTVPKKDVDEKEVERQRRREEKPKPNP